MANLKSNLKSKHLYYISLAFEQAKVNLGSTGTNPSVGCIIENNDTVLSSGRTSLLGRPHAEFNALKKSINFKDSNLYVTLEPCSHFGVTPPCTKKIVKKKIKNVFFSVFDLDSRTRKKSLLDFKKSKIKVVSDIARKFGLDFYKSYFLKHKKLLPYIDAKIAISRDFFYKNKRSKWITNKHSRKRAHLLRTSYDCILTTSKTINDDNSRLNCRLEGLENKSPSIVIIDRFFKLKKNSKIVKEKSKRKIILFTTTYNKEKKKYFNSKGIKIIQQKNMKNKKDFKLILSNLRDLGISRILVESGMCFLNFLILGSFVHNLFVFKSNYNLKKNGINYGKINIIKNLNLKNKINVNLLGDFLYKVKLK